MRLRRRPALDGLNTPPEPAAEAPPGVEAPAAAPSRPRHGSIQDVHFRIESIERDTLRLAGKEFRAVVECIGVAVHILPVEEQEGVLAGQAAFLNALPFPTQLLVRIERRNLEPHIQAIQRGIAAFASRPETTALAHVADGYVKYLRGLHEQAVLLDRRCYIIIPADPVVVQAALPVPPTRLQRLLSLLTHRQPEGQDDDDVGEGRPGRDQRYDPREAIYEHLQFRCEQVIRLLGRSGMQAWRVTGPALHHLLYSCWNPEQARLHALGQDHLAFHLDGAPAASIVAHQVRR